MILGLTELMGLYAVSSVVLIRKQLPHKYRYGKAASTTRTEADWTGSKFCSLSEGINAMS